MAEVPPRDRVLPATNNKASPAVPSTGTIGSAGASSSAPKLPPPPLNAPKPNNPFVYLGIPQWVFDYRPKPPSRNTSIFLTVVAGITGAFVYDRRECKSIQEEYINKVKWMSEQPLDAAELARRVRVFGARVPEDGELERSSKWFKRYIRPLLVASGTDYQLMTATNPGGLGRSLLHEFRSRRITAASKDPKAETSAYNKDGVNPPSVLEERDAQYEAQEVDGGIVLLGRGALKEYLWALRKGYSEQINLREEARLQGLGLGVNEKRKDGRWEREEELMLRELEREDEKSESAPFEMKESLEFQIQGDGEGEDGDVSSSMTTASSASPMTFAPYLMVKPVTAPPPTKSSDSEESSAPFVLPPPEQLPPQPPLLLVPFSHPFGIRTWPAKMIHFFNKRSDVKLGAEQAMMIINNQTRPLEAPVLRKPDGTLRGILDDTLVNEVRQGMHKDLVMEEGVLTGSPDLDFLAETDEEPTHFRKTYRKLPSAHEFGRRTFYTKDLPDRLVQARELANGRTPTKAESKFPPKLESELRKERLDKELKWRRELEGWAVQRSGSGIAWDEKWGTGKGTETPFKVFRAVSEADMQALERDRDGWERERADKEQAQQQAWAQSDSESILE